MGEDAIKIPNLVIVGEPKCGTTSLHYYLDQHPEIYMSSEKEPEFFCTDLRRESDKFYGRKEYFKIRTEEEFLKLFKKKNKKIYGESSTANLFSKEAAKNIHKTNPDAKIIAVFREPVNLLYSLHAEYLAEFKENIVEFEEALKEEKNRKKGKNIPIRVGTPSMLFYSERVKFAEHLKRYYNLFKKKNVLVITIEDLNKKQEETYKKILTFLEVDEHFAPDFSRKNERREVRSKSMKKVMENKGVWKITKKIIPYFIYKRLYGLLRPILFKQSKVKKIDPEVKKRLMKKFKPEVDKLSKLIKRDLIKEWGYENI